jgi:pSer/pThr/pTyr-binding forkhead associated (FHA) protein
MIWVEILSRHRDVVARHRCDGAEVRIGRGYDNDVIVDDPYVAPHHLRVFRDEDGRLVAEDLGSANGLYTGDGERREKRIAIDGDRPLRIGRTQLRIRESSHVVAPERAAAPVARRWPAGSQQPCWPSSSPRYGLARRPSRRRPAICCRCSYSPR